MTHGLYLVTGKRAYRGHEPGTEFEDVLDPGPASRAIARGDIRLLRWVEPELQPGTYRLPDDGWPPGQAHQTNRGAERRLSH